MDGIQWEEVKNGNTVSLEVVVFSPSTSKRQHALHQFRDHLAGSQLSPQVYRQLLLLLFKTYQVYVDRASRTAAQRAARILISAPIPHDDLQQFVQILRKECFNSAIAPANAFVLVEWCNMLLQHLSGHLAESSSLVLDVVSGLAKALETCFRASTKSGLKHSAIIVARRALRSVLFVESHGPALVRELALQLTKEVSSGYKNAPMLGVLCGVCARNSSIKPALEEVKGEILQFYSKEIISSKSAPPRHIYDGVHDLFDSFVGVEDLQKFIWPPVEKAILRSPEVILSGPLISLASAIPKNIDLSEVFLSSLCKPLLSNIKSTNIEIRKGAVEAFEAFVSRCGDAKALLKVADEVVSPLKKLANAEQRALYGQILQAIPTLPGVSQFILDGLSPTVARESNELAIESEIKAFCYHLSSLVSTGASVGKEHYAVLIKGCDDKRIGVRKLWLVNMGELFWAVDGSCVLSSQEFVEGCVNKVLPLLQKSFNEIAPNPIPSVQGGAVSMAYVLVALMCQKFKGQGALACSAGAIVPTTLSLSPKPSFLLNQKVYTKLSSKEDMLWNIRALAAISQEPAFSKADALVQDAWAQAFLYMICSSNRPPKILQNAVQSLRKCYLNNTSLIGPIILKSLWGWLCGLDTSDKESAAVISGTLNLNLFHVVNAITPAVSELEDNSSIDKTSLESLLIDMLVLCRPQLIPGASWVNLVLKTGVDPGELVRNHPDKCLEQVLLATTDSTRSKITKGRQAAWNAAADLGFVAPDVMIPKLVSQFEGDLDVDRITRFSATDIAISRHQEETPFVNVLDTKTKQPDKSAKDYDTLKWEEEVRAEVARKHGQPQKKLTAEEHSKVKAQLMKESTIRSDVKVQEEILRRGAGIVKSLALSAPIDAGTWINEAVNSLSRLVRAGAGVLVGDDISLSFLACSQRISPRLGELRRFIGIATLRALGKTYLSPELESEPLGSLVTRIMYRLRIISEQRPLDIVSLGYILPLIFNILEQDGIEETKDEAGGQVLLALEVISFHANSFLDPRLPRRETLSLMIRSMQRHTEHYKLIRDALLDLCRGITPNIQSEELETLLQGTIVSEIPVRTAVLQSVLAEIDLTDLDFSEHIWIAYHDLVAENAEIAKEIWEVNALDIDENSPGLIMKYLWSKDLQLRTAAANALAHACEIDPDLFPGTLEKLKSRYREDVRPKPTQKDSYGMPRQAEPVDNWELRSGIALALGAMAGGFQADEIVAVIRFLIDEGPLIDRNGLVRRQMAEGGNAVVALRGQEKVEELMNLLETTLETSDKATEESDWLNEAVIIFYGSLARHLHTGDKRIQKVTRKLLEAVSTPSETVQLAVARCLSPLVRLDDSESSQFVKQLLDQLLQSKNYATRRGAAYGLAGIVHGKGISALREFGIMTALKEAAENKRDQNQRQGAIIAFELLSLILGQIFEPYVIQIVPQLLTGFGDPSVDVRDACLDAAKSCFASLSSFGVKQILPTLLEGLDDSQWRSKKGACDLLGAMAYLDPQQLALNLPDIIPPLTDVLNDSHKEVRNSANRSLQRFGEVINNPEVKSLVSILLKALSDPTKHTEEALDALIKVSFIHYLDAPSLALVVRILERGLGDRSATKRKAAQIIGSLAHLTERKDITVHLPILVAGLKLAIVDPVPTTRATASKALGSLIEKLGEDSLPDLIPSLMATLKSESGAGDRLGSAQALAEVLAGLGTSRLEDSLPSFLQNASSPKPTVREGFMTLFIFLPACFGNSFAAYLGRIIPPILSGLADEVEAIRETSLRAGRLLVKNFSARSIDLLLPELERGLANDNYRIRLSSVELIGDLLFNLTGTSTQQDEDEQIDTAAQAAKSLLEVLGEEKRNKVLSSLYICRCDTSGLVRTAAINVWKALVATPRTLKELVPTLSQAIIRRLGSSNMEQKVIAGNALGELIKKAGEGVLSTLLPALEEGLVTSTDSDGKQGICIAVRELVTSSSSESLEIYEQPLVSIVRTALVDSNQDVREAAAEAFDSLQQCLGKRIVDRVLPDLLHLLHNDNEAEQALAALLTLLTEATRANIILPNLIPTLLTRPITVFNAKALASLAEVSNMNRRLPAILNALMEEIISTKDEDTKTEISNAFDVVLDSVDEFDGLNTAMNVMLTLMKHDDHRRRANAALHLATFFANTELDISRFYPELIRVLLISFDDHDKDVVKSAWEGLSQLTKSMRKEEMEALVVPTRQILKQVGVPGSNLPGFCLPKGISAILPIFLQGLLNGSTDQRVQSALAIGDITDRTSPEALKGFVTQITGPLIRVVSERSVDLKCAIFLALNKLLEKIPLFVKPFVPQLQRTFARGLADTSSEILRTRAAKGLGILITITPRVDPLVSELITGSKTPDAGVKNAMLRALHEVVDKAAANMSDTSKQAVLSLVEQDSSENDDASATTNARLAGTLLKSLSGPTAATFIKSRILGTQLTHSSVLRLNAALLDAPTLLSENFATETVSMICQAVQSTDVYISEHGILAAGKYLLSTQLERDPEGEKLVFEALVPAVKPGTPVDTRRIALVVLRTIGRKTHDILHPHLPSIIPAVFSGVRDTVIPVKLAAEAAFLSLFSVVEKESLVFDDYMKGPGAELPPTLKRSIQDYFKRVALRLAGQARERREAEGGQGVLGLSSDELEDEKEIWSIGKLELGDIHGDD